MLGGVLMLVCFDGALHKSLRPESFAEFGWIFFQITKLRWVFNAFGHGPNLTSSGLAGSLGPNSVNKEATNVAGFSCNFVCRGELLSLRGLGLPSDFRPSPRSG